MLILTTSENGERMSSKTKKSKSKSKSIETDGRLVQTRIPPDDYVTVEKMANGMRLSMASTLRTLIASQADAYRAAQKSVSSLGRSRAGEGKGGEILSIVPGEDHVGGDRIVSLATGADGSFGSGEPLTGIGVFALTADGTVLALCRAKPVLPNMWGLLRWVKVEASRGDLDLKEVVSPGEAGSE